MSWLVVLATLTLGVLVLALVGYRWNLRDHRRRYEIREFPGFLTPEECAHLIERARPVLRKSRVVLGRETDLMDTGRGSSSAFLEATGDSMIRKIKLRIAELTETRVEFQELIQVTHYTAGQSYARHYDSLRASRQDLGAAGDRYCTMIMYLNDDYRGGATYFPRVRRRVTPELGKAVLFYNLEADGAARERLSLHTGEPVRDGEKWLSNQWIRQRRCGGQRDAGRSRRP